MAEIFTKNVVQERTWNDVLNDVATLGSTGYEIPGQTMNEATDGGSSSDNSGTTQVGGKIIGAIFDKCTFKSGITGSRIEIFPDANTSMIAYDVSGNESFKIMQGGATAGDVIMGNVAGGQYAQWDSSAGTLTVVGAISVSAGGTIGGFEVGADYVRDVANTFGLASTVTVGDDIRFWAGASFVNRASANAYITESGEALFKYVTISGGSNVKFISDTINTESGYILKDFDFGSADYAGGVYAGDITWNSTTGAITGGSGVLIYRKGIVGANAGVTTFSVDSTTGNATFAGTLSAAGGTLGVITTGLITLDSTGYIRAGATGYMTGTGFFLGYDTDAYKFRVGTTTEYISFDGSTFDITVPINTPHYFTMYMPWKTSNSALQYIPTDLNKMWEIKCVSSNIEDKPIYIWVGILGENSQSSSITYYIRLLKYKRNKSGEYDYTGTYWQKSGGVGGQEQIFSICQYGANYVYVVWKEGANYKLSRLDISNLGNEQTVTGLNSTYPYISTNGTKLYFYNDTTTVKVFTVTNATTVTDDSTDITLASDPGTRHFLCDGTSFYFTGTGNIKKYTVSNGALSATSDSYNVPDNAVASTATNRILSEIPGSTIKDNGGFWSQGIIHRVLQQVVCNALTTGPSASVYMKCTADTYTYLEAIPCPEI